MKQKLIKKLIIGFVAMSSCVVAQSFVGSNQALAMEDKVFDYKKPLGKLKKDLIQVEYRPYTKEELYDESAKFMMFEVKKAYNLKKIIEEIYRRKGWLRSESLYSSYFDVINGEYVIKPDVKNRIYDAIGLNLEYSNLYDEVLNFVVDNGVQHFVYSEPSCVELVERFNRELVDKYIPKPFGFDTSKLSVDKKVDEKNLSFVNTGLKSGGLKIKNSENEGQDIRTKFLNSTLKESKEADFRLQDFMLYEEVDKKYGLTDLFEKIDVLEKRLKDVHLDFDFKIKEFDKAGCCKEVGSLIDESEEKLNQIAKDFLKKIKVYDKKSDYECRVSLDTYLLFSNILCSVREHFHVLEVYFKTILSDYDNKFYLNADYSIKEDDDETIKKLNSFLKGLSIDKNYAFIADAYHNRN